MKIVLAVILVVCGFFVWAMMEYTSMGYTGWGIVLGPLAVLSGLLVAFDKG